MIRLFVCDIDGCLAEPYRPFDLEGLGALARHAARAEDESPVEGNAPRDGARDGAADDPSPRPALSICSGRPYAYVEAMTQALGLAQPVLFESGAGCFDPATARTTWHPDFTGEVEEQLEAVREWMTRDLLPGTAMSFDYNKRTQAGLVGPDEQEIAATVPVVRRFLEEHAAELRVFATGISVDVLAPGLTKKQGIRWLAGRLGVALGEIAFIGDSEGDIEALESVGLPLAPANADAAVQEAVRGAGGHVTEARVLEGTLEAYRYCVAQNEQQATPAA